MSNLLDNAKSITDTVIVRMSDGYDYYGPVWKDAVGTFVLYKNERVPVSYIFSRGRWFIETNL